MITLLKVEIAKLRRSLVLLLLAGIPAMVMLVVFVIIASDNGPKNWNAAVMGGAAIWAYFLFPMTATALTALIAQIEHSTKGWSYALTLPHPKWSIFVAKAILCWAAMAFASALIWGGILLGAFLASNIFPNAALTGDIPTISLAVIIAKMWLAGGLMIAIQFAVAIRFSSFAIPSIVGITGTFIALIATGAKAGIYFPWLLPTNVLASTPERALQAILTGGLGGILLFVLVCVVLSRRDWA